MNILFFGSTSDSVIVLTRLPQLPITNYRLLISAVVTQPPRPVGRDQIMTPTPVETWAKEQHITVLSFPSNPEKPWFFADEEQVIDTLEPVKADILISASFGVKIPWETIERTKFGGINIHPSILPRWRGADPVPWAILTGDHQIGVSVLTLSKEFDKGVILAQKKIPILPSDTSDPLRTKLFTIGADLLIDLLPSFLARNIKPKSQSTKFMHVHKVSGSKPFPYARKFKREDGFIEWDIIYNALTEGMDAERIERTWRALHPWPGVWTEIGIRDKGVGYRKKRVKILKLHLHPMPNTLHPTLVIDEVQIEGKKPVSWQQFQNAYLQ